MKAYKGGRYTATLILNLGTRWQWLLQAQALYPEKRTLVPPDENGDSASDLVWKF
jgi:hypothetical protein